MITVEEIQKMMEKERNPKLPAGSKLIKTVTSRPAPPSPIKVTISNSVEDKGRTFVKRTTLIRKYELIEEVWEIPTNLKEV